jgi:hypothetical protein
MWTADEQDVTAQPLFDGTFSTDAVAAAGHALLEQLHQEAMATIAALAENWDQPDQPSAAAAAADDEPTTWSDPETWSVEDEEDDEHAVRLLQRFELPAVLPRTAAPRLSLVDLRPTEDVAADAPTGEIEVEVPQPVAV